MTEKERAIERLEARVARLRRQRAEIDADIARFEKIIEQAKKQAKKENA